MRTAVNDTNRRVRERLAAWLVTGPLGHLVAGVADWIELLWAARRRRRRR
jgi:hypothetical protein